MNDQVKWAENNDQHLAATIAWVRLRLEQLILPLAEKPEVKHPKKCRWFSKTSKTPQAKTNYSNAVDDATIEQARQEILKLENSHPQPALILLGQSLGLTPFDQQVLALCCAMELDTGIAGLCARAQADLNKAYPTFALAFKLFDDPDWNSLAPLGALRHWRLLEINQPGATPLTGTALAIDERIVNYLKGLNYLDDRLTVLLEPAQFDSIEAADTKESLPASQQQTIQHIIERLNNSNGRDKTPVIELKGHDSASKILLAEQVAALLAVNLYTIDISTLPAQTGDFETFARLWQRESILMPLALYINIDSDNEVEQAKLKRFLARSTGIIFLDSDDVRIEIRRNRFAVEVSKPTPEEQLQLWIDNIRDAPHKLPQRLAEQFSFSHKEIKRLAYRAEKEITTNESGANLATDDLWQLCRLEARTGMEQLAGRIDVKANWSQLILSPEQNTLLHQITDQVAQRNRVYENWGFRDQMNRGLGLNALFAGESGTGKTMAAEVIANALELDLYRIDLSSVVSKYIGETEKNLRKLFDAAEDSGAILFFDEADALFGKRSEVKDSHDRYANIEINYLLQRMESYRGLAILATNMKSSLDKAFMRRLRFIVDFHFPDIEQRKEIWQKVFPSSTPVENLDYERLAKLNLTGGSILNVALNAAFLAAEGDSSVTMPLVLNAARTEFKKLERPAKESDFRWLKSGEKK